MKGRYVAWALVVAIAWASDAAMGAKKPAPGAGPQAKAVQTVQTTDVKVPADIRRSDKPAESVQLQYQLYLPQGYDQADKAKRRPLMLFLHGAGERGDNIDRVKVHGPPKLVEKGRKFPFIIVSPQCPTKSWWTPAMLIPLLDELIKKYAVDPDRIYCTGLSMGGFGTWALAREHPNRLAAIVPICGRGDPKKVAPMKDTPTWAFHGGKDGVVPPKGSREMVAAMKAAGAKNVRLTIYPDAGHDSWTQAYNDPELYKWLLKQKLSDRLAKPAKGAAPAQ